MSNYDAVQKELLKECLKEIDWFRYKVTENEISTVVIEKLIAHNVIVMPCNVGDFIYKVDRVYKTVRKQIVTGFVHNGKWLRIRAIDANKTSKAKYKDNYISLNEYKKSMFLTKAEAEEELKRRGW